jgi:DNA polymerase III delta subunit
MITLLLGTDGLAKKQYIAGQAKISGSEVVTFTENTDLPDVASLFEPQLFGAPKAVVLDHIWKQLEPEKLLEQLGNNAPAMLFIIEDSLDKRKKVNQEFLKDKRVQVVELNAPVGTAAAGQWIADYCKQQGIKIDTAASSALAQSLLTDEDDSLDVARAQNELRKLATYASGKPITAEMVHLLVEPTSGVDTFELLNAIATKNKPQALALLENYFATETTDEKTTAIKVTALLADQFRSLQIALDAAGRRLPDQAVLEMTGWKSGRLFIMKKLSRNFTAPQVRQALGKLESLDRELKSSTLPPHVVLDLIIADM